MTNEKKIELNLNSNTNSPDSSTKIALYECYSHCCCSAFIESYWTSLLMVMMTSDFLLLTHGCQKFSHSSGSIGMFDYVRACLWVYVRNSLCQSKGKKSCLKYNNLNFNARWPDHRILFWYSKFRCRSFVYSEFSAFLLKKKLKWLKILRMTMRKCNAVDSKQFYWFHKTRIKWTNKKRHWKVQH